MFASVMLRSGRDFRKPCDRCFDDMFQEHETLRFIPGRETDDTEPNVEDEERLSDFATQDFGHELIQTVFRVQPNIMRASKTRSKESSRSSWKSSRATFHFVC